MDLNAVEVASDIGGKFDESISYQERNNCGMQYSLSGRRGTYVVLKVPHLVDVVLYVGHKVILEHKNERNQKKI